MSRWSSVLVLNWMNEWFDEWCYLSELLVDRRISRWDKKKKKKKHIDRRKERTTSFCSPKRPLDFSFLSPIKWDRRYSLEFDLLVVVSNEREKIDDDWRPTDQWIFVKGTCFLHEIFLAKIVIFSSSYEHWTINRRLRLFFAFSSSFSDLYRTILLFVSSDLLSCWNTKTEIDKIHLASCFSNIWLNSIEMPFALTSGKMKIEFNFSRRIVAFFSSRFDSAVLSGLVRSFEQIFERKSPRKTFRVDFWKWKIREIDAAPSETSISASFSFCSIFSFEDFANDQRKRNENQPRMFLSKFGADVARRTRKTDRSESFGKFFESRRAKKRVFFFASNVFVLRFSEFPIPNVPSIDAIENRFLEILRSEPLVENLCFRYGDLCALDTISVDLVPEKKGVLLRHVEYKVMSLVTRRKRRNKKSTRENRFDFFQRHPGNVFRRYKDFLSLNEFLSMKYPFRVLPQLPPKKSVNGSKFRQNRREIHFVFTFSRSNFHRRTTSIVETLPRNH